MSCHTSQVFIYNVLCTLHIHGNNRINVNFIKYETNSNSAAKHLYKDNIVIIQLESVQCLLSSISVKFNKFNSTISSSKEDSSVIIQLKSI